MRVKKSIELKQNEILEIFRKHVPGLQRAQYICLGNRHHAEVYWYENEIVDGIYEDEKKVKK